MEKAMSYFEKIDLSEPFYGRIELGNITALNVGMFKTADGIFVGIEGFGAYIFHSWVHYSYAMEKLKLGEADARNFSDFLNIQLGDTSKSFQGRYY